MLARERKTGESGKRAGKGWAVWGNEDERGGQRRHRDKSSRDAGEW